MLLKEVDIFFVSWTITTNIEMDFLPHEEEDYFQSFKGLVTKLRIFLPLVVRYFSFSWWKQSPCEARQHWPCDAGIANAEFIYGIWHMGWRRWDRIGNAHKPF